MTVTEQNEQDIKRRDLKKKFPHIFGVSDSDKCKKGHSYRKMEQKFDSLLKVDWICANCGRHL